MLKDEFSLCHQVLDGKIRVERVAGKGGCSIVYRGFDDGLRCAVAIKCLQTELSPKKRGPFLEALQQEAQHLVRLNKRTLGAVHVHSAGSWTTPEGEWVPYIELEWLDGLPLDELVVPSHDERGAVSGALGDGQGPLATGTIPWTPIGARLPLHVVIGLLDRAARALAEAHKINIAHRDIKPSNLFIERSDQGVPQSKVIDFGIAKHVIDGLTPSGARTMTGQGVHALTPEYAAPEQWEGKYGTTGSWTDVFSFALVCVELVTGCRALEGDVLPELIVSCTGKLRPTPAAKGVLLSPEVEKVFVKALAVDPMARYPDMDKFWNALTEAADFHGVNTEIEQELVTMFGAMLERSGEEGVKTEPTQQAKGSSQTGARSAQTGRGRLVGPERTLSDMGAGQRGRSPAGVQRLGALVAGSLALVGLTAGVTYLVVHRPEPVSQVTDAGPDAERDGGSTVSMVPTVSMRTERCPDGMVYIAGGVFDMGSDDKLTKHDCGLGEENAESEPWPKHRESLVPYCLDVFEVTVEKYKRCVDAGKCARPGHTDEAPLEANNPYEYNKLNHPVNLVRYADAKLYCAEHRSRLPTEAEWEYAARGPEGFRYPWGNWPTDRLLTCADVHQKDRMYAAAFGEALSGERAPCFKVPHGTWPVGEAKEGVSPFGIFDMAGNVMEWVDAGPLSIVRGGGWSHGGGAAACKLRTYWREKQPLGARDAEIGFRCAAAPLPGVTAPK